MLGLINKIFIRLLTGLVSGSNHTKCILLSNQKWKIQPTLINLHPNEYSQEFHDSPFSVKLDRCAGSCNTIIDLSSKACVPNKTEDLNLCVFNMSTRINESKTVLYNGVFWRATGSDFFQIFNHVKTIKKPLKLPFHKKHHFLR